VPYVKGRQLYVGVYKSEEKAARAYDCAAIKLLGSEAKLNVRPVHVFDCLVLGDCARANALMTRGTPSYQTPPMHSFQGVTTWMLRRRQCVSG
jgi:hypothetical protein